MKRDMDLIRELLILIENQEDDSRELKLPTSIDRSFAVYQLRLLEQAGYTKNNIHYADNKPMWIYSSLTWDGQEFLGAIKNETVWRKVKQTLVEKGGSIPMEVLKSLAIKISEGLFLS